MSQSDNQDHDKAFSSEVAELIINLALFPVQRILAHKTVALELNSLGGDFLPHTVIQPGGQRGGKHMLKLGTLIVTQRSATRWSQTGNKKKAVSNIY